MFCAKCGQSNPDNAMRCGKCGAPFLQATVPQQQPGNPYGAPMQAGGTMAPPGMQKPSNNLVLSIISAIPCCGCLPLGIVAIVFAVQVDSKWNAGDYAGAKDSSNKARLFSIISIAIAVIALVGYLIFGVIIMSSPEFQKEMQKQQRLQQQQQMQRL